MARFMAVVPTIYPAAQSIAVNSVKIPSMVLADMLSRRKATGTLASGATMHVMVVDGLKIQIAQATMVNGPSTGNRARPLLTLQTALPMMVTGLKATSRAAVLAFA